MPRIKWGEESGTGTGGGKRDGSDIGKGEESGEKKRDRSDIGKIVGANDARATDEQPDGFNAPGNNMVKTATNFFDNANPVGGNNLLTAALQHVDDNPDNDRRTDFAHDFRNRNYLTTAFISTTGTPVSVVTLKTFDNLDGIVGVAQYNTTVGTGHLIRQSATLIDNLRRGLSDAGQRRQRRHDERESPSTATPGSTP